MRGQGEVGKLSSAVAIAAVAPLVAEPTVRAEQVTQLVLGETARILDPRGEWRRVRSATDGYEGWVHRGYVRELADAEADAWASLANAWSEGAEATVGGAPVRLPLRARVALADGGVMLPDGRRGSVTLGRVRPAAAVAEEARAVPAVEWAARHFLGAPYQWGGVTPWGVDCSGLVQTTFAARGVQLPRDSAHQAHIGDAVPLDAIAPGDLLLFRSESGSEAITHVAFAAPNDMLLHSTIACGGVVHEPWQPGTRAAALRARLVAARRLAR